MNLIADPDRPDRPDRLIVALSSLASAAYVLFTGRALPGVVAVYYGQSGAAEGWMSRSLYLALMVLIASGLPASLWWMHRQRARAHRYRPAVPAVEIRTPVQMLRQAYLRWHAAALVVAMSVFLCRIHGLLLRAHGELPSAAPQFDIGALVHALSSFALFGAVWLLLLRFAPRR